MLVPIYREKRGKPVYLGVRDYSGISCEMHIVVSETSSGLLGNLCHSQSVYYKNIT
jgi:hypothetical protein